MRISKIELQNINSLKADRPLVIDFDNDTFRDVGLYAITGSTGAGKTTILDAITIALYQSVPRFKGTKGTLLNVVSYGASEAFSRVTFENNGVTYEAYWGIRLATKTGKALKNPQEEVRLRDISTGKTIAESKTKVAEEVVRVTQLDYDQFLRSVMLAQGEFASFLSAKGPEKGRLLEQITGEEIYKKIGQSILDRKSSEETKLKEIQARINSDDVLTNEQNTELKQKDKALDAQIIATNKEIDTAQGVVNWYLKSHELELESEKLERDFKILNSTIETHKDEFRLLEISEKAEPFAPFIEKINRNLGNSIDKAKQLETLENQLIRLKPEIERLTTLHEKQSVELENANKEFSSWLPKFDAITKLDGELKSQVENKQKIQTNLEDLTRQIAVLEKEKNLITKDIADIKTKIGINEAFVSKHKFLSAVDLEISNWTTKLTSLKGNKETLHENVAFVAHKKKEIESTNAELAKNEQILRKKSLEVGVIEKQISAINAKLSKNNLTALFAEQKQGTSAVANWKQLKAYAEEKAKKEEEHLKINAQKEKLSQDLVSIRQQAEMVQNQILAQEAAVADAEKMLNLEKSLAKYEEDRKHLIEGQPCSLCGSTEHPYATNLVSVGVSKSELELNTRKEKLKNLSDVKSELDKKEVALKTSSQSFTQQLLTITKELSSISSKAAQINNDADLKDITKIDLALNASVEKLNDLEEKIRNAQQLQAQKDTLTETYNTQNKTVEQHKRTAATLSEKIKNTQEEISAKQKTIATLTERCRTLEQNLKENLSKYNYELPTIENTMLFIETIEKEIVGYNKTQKELDDFKAKIGVLDSKLNHNKIQLDKLSKDKAEYTEEIGKSDALAVQLRTQRASILPLEITVTSKREHLQARCKQLAETHDASSKQLQELRNSQREKEVLKVENIKEQKALKEELDVLQSSLQAQLEGTIFRSKEDLEKALLNKEDKQKYQNYKDRIKEQDLKLRTLKETHLKALEDLNKRKTFEISEADSKRMLTELKTKKDTLSAEKGEIKEAFRKDHEIRERNKEISKKIDDQVKVCGVWKDLFRIIGNSKDAFNVYVQRLTLKHLLDLANVHLYKLNKRYSLKMEETYKPKEELNFNLIDHYQTDQARLVDTSSGGEKFIISLALALGLSDLASKNVKIDSLFIDEGFGSLDNNTLETVISTLETLQAQGKMIGIISHVENLKERIPTQIQITKKSNGVSVVDLL